MGARDDKQLEAARSLIRDLAERLDLNAWARLWDGTRLPLGKAPTSNFEISISDPGVIGSIVRRPGLDTIIRQYIEKGIDFSGGTLIDFGRDLQSTSKAPKLRARDIASVGLKLTPFLFEKERKTRDAYGFEGDITGAHRKTADNKDYIQFHYDLSNDFYALFLDPEMVYSCAYYTDWSNGVEQAQRDKLEMICRKLRLKPGDRM